MTKKHAIGVRLDEISAATLEELRQDIQTAHDAKFGPGVQVTQSTALRLILLSLGRADRDRVGERRSLFRKWIRAYYERPLFG